MGGRILPPGFARGSITVITFPGMKGGAGKSTDAVLLANNLAARGFRVLFFDMGTNSSATIYCTPGMADEFPTQNVAEGYAVKSRIPNVDIVPSSLRLFDIRPGDYHALKKTLPDGKYDFVVIDTAPTYDNLVMNALYAADCIFTPPLSLSPTRPARLPQPHHLALLPRAPL